MQTPVRVRRQHPVTGVPSSRTRCRALPSGADVAALCRLGGRSWKSAQRRRLFGAEEIEPADGVHTELSGRTERKELGSRPSIGLNRPGVVHPEVERSIDAVLRVADRGCEDLPSGHPNRRIQHRSLRVLPNRHRRQCGRDLRGEHFQVVEPNRIPTGMLDVQDVLDLSFRTRIVRLPLQIHGGTHQVAVERGAHHDVRVRQ